MMASKEELKEKFSTGKKPTGEDFAELIDGVEGPAGKDGTNGKDGAKGSPGEDGKDGAKGADGKDAENQFTEEEVTSLKALIEEE